MVVWRIVGEALDRVPKLPGRWSLVVFLRRPIFRNVSYQTYLRNDERKTAWAQLFYALSKRQHDPEGLSSGLKSETCDYSGNLKYVTCKRDVTPLL